MMNSIRIRTLMLGAACIVLPGAAIAGGGNEIYVLQESATGLGNKLEIDQSGANDSLVRGLGDSELAPATQKGDGNSADLTITGNGGEIRLEQDNFATGQPGNTANVTVDGGNLATVQQLGSGNLATLGVSGSLTEGGIFQNGDGNNALLTVSGSNTSGSVTQNGDGNETALTVTGNGTAVDYTLNGNSVTNVPGGGVQVINNGAQVTITQTAIVPISR